MNASPPDRADSAGPSRSGMWMEIPAGRFALMLGLLILAAFPDVIFGLRTFFIRDYGFFGYPLAHYHRESFWRGEIPLWNPLNNCGLPFLAQWNTMVLYPGTLLYLLFPLSWSLGIFCLAHQFLAGIAMYFLARHWTGNRAAAAVAGVAFAFNGLTLNCLMWPNNIAALGWMPLVVLWAQRSWTGSRRSLVIAILAGAMQMLTGAPEIILFTWVIVASLALLEGARRPSGAGRIFARLSMVIAGVGLLSAAQLLPFLDLLRHSQRTSDFANADWSMPATGWANFFVPTFRYAQARHGVMYQWGQYWTSSYYAGVGILLLAGLGLWTCRRDKVLLLGGLTLFTLLLALGDAGHLYSLLRHWIPLGFVRYPIKFVVPVIFCLALLAAFGLGAFMQSEPGHASRRRLVALWVVGLAVMGMIVWFSARFPLPEEKFERVWQSALSRAGFLTGLTILLILWRHQRNSRRAVLWQVTFLFLIFLDGITHLPRQNPTIPRTLLSGRASEAASSPRHGESRAMLSQYADSRLRFLSTSDAQKDYVAFRLGLFSNCNLLEDIPKLNGFYSLYPLGPYQVVSQLYGMTNTEALPLLDFLGVAQVTAPGEFYIWTNRPGFMPLVTAGQRVEKADDATAFNRMFEMNFQPREVVYLPPAGPKQKSEATGPARATIKGHYRANQIQLETQADGPTVAVIAQSFYPRWQAVLDGKPVRILRANYAFQAVEIPAGQHRLTLDYRDTWFYWGCALSLATLLICFWLWKTAGAAARPGEEAGGV